MSRDQELRPRAPSAHFRMHVIVIQVDGEDIQHDAPDKTPVSMPPITPASAASPFNPCSQDCPVCLNKLGGECLMTQCRHAMHKKCTTEMFNQGINVCALCRAPITALLSETLEESPNASEETSADSHPETPKAPEE